jgi:hypothetical protein
VRDVGGLFRHNQPLYVESRDCSELAENARGLIHAALSAHLALLTTEGRATRRRDTTYLERFATLRGLLIFRRAELRAAREARAAVEARYFASHTALFPAEVKARDEQLKNTETLADVGSRLAELDGVPPAEPPDHEAVAARVTGLVADLIEPAKTTALEKLGEGEPALRIGAAWLRAKMTPSDLVGEARLEPLAVRGGRATESG